jgi:hypothetical protein
MDFSIWLAVLAGIGIAAACGLRAFLPLLLLGIAARTGWIALQPGAQWIASDHALWALGAATVLEIAADKIPIVDHALDAVGTLLRPAAAWLGAYAVMVQLPTPWAQLAAAALGGAALVVHGLKAKLRLGSTTVTLGHANPLLSIIEDALALLGGLIAVLAPAAIALGVLVVVVWLARPGRRSAARPPA